MVDEVLDEISDAEDIPIEVVTQKIKERRARVQAKSKAQPNTEYTQDDFVQPPVRQIYRFV
jgi:F420-dependent methylenetetrahydromethanopterin dehydrogenase